MIMALRLRQEDFNLPRCLDPTASRQNAGVTHNLLRSVRHIAVGKHKHTMVLKFEPFPDSYLKKIFNPYLLNSIKSLLRCSALLDTFSSLEIAKSRPELENIRLGKGLS